MDELLVQLLGSAKETNKKIEDLGTRLEEKIQEVVKEAVDPLKTRLNTVETSIADLRTEVNSDMLGLRVEVSKDMADFREQLSSLKTASAPKPGGESSRAATTGQTEEPTAETTSAISWATVSSRTTPQPSAVISPGGNSARQRRIYLEVARKRKIGLDKDMISVMEKAGRTIAFCPIQAEEVQAIQKEMEEREEYDGANMKEEAMRKAITEYLTGEMKMTDPDCSQLSITEVFAPKYKDYRTVYAVFATLEEAEKVLSMCLYLRHSNRVTNHIPWRARDRHNAVEGRAKLYRDRGYRTRISIRDSDYSLLVKHRVEPGGWRLATDVDNLPPFSPAQSARPRDSSTSPGQAGGRTLRVSLRKHPRSPTSEAAEAPTNKKSRISKPPADEGVTMSDCEEEDEPNYIPPGEYQEDRGNFTSIQSASPAKARALRRGQLSRELMNLR